MKKEYTWVILAGTMAAGLMLAGCGDTARPAAQSAVSQSASARKAGAKIDLTKVKDGTYKAESSPDDKGAVGRLTVTVEGHKITAAEFVGVKKDGTIKADDYGKTNGEIENPVFYKKAQLAVKANAKYAEELLQKQALDEVDAVSGATVSYKQFQEAAEKALAGK